MLPILKLSNFIGQFRHQLLRLEQNGERQLILQALSLGNHLPKWLGGLDEAEYCAFSQSGEDGIIHWLADQIPDIPKSFIEFGVGDYRESNTRFLLQAKNWQGFIMDGSDENIAEIQTMDFYWRNDLTAKQAFIDRDNINSLISEFNLPSEIGLLSIDIDGNDYWVWQAINVVKPAIVVCEYNAVFGDLYSLTVPYQANFQRTQAHSSNLYFGASIRALIALGKEKAYTFVGTNSIGCNAFFVRNDLAPKVVSALGGIWLFPSMVREARNSQGQLMFTSGKARAELIGNLSLVDLNKNAQCSLNSIQNLYSAEWAKSTKTKI